MPLLFVDLLSNCLYRFAPSAVLHSCLSCIWLCMRSAVLFLFVYYSALSNALFHSDISVHRHSPRCIAIQISTLNRVLGRQIVCQPKQRQLEKQ